MRKFYFVIAFLMICLSGNSQDKSVSGTFKQQRLFEAGTNGYFTYRIASLVATKNDVLLAFCAARKGQGGDWDPIDIVMRRSSDLGKTWEPLKVIAHFDDQWPTDNATPIVDYQTGSVHLLYGHNIDRCFYIRSDDDGKTFTDQREITSVLEGFRDQYKWVVTVPGPGHGIQMSNGRLVLPFWMSDGSSKEFGPKLRGHRPSIVVSVYSDDHGKTWERGEVVAWNDSVIVVPNETSCIQLADGRVMFNMRNESMNYRRLISYSENGATNWTHPEFADAFFEPICYASMVRYSIKPYQSQNRILFCNPDSRNITMNIWKGATPYSAASRARKNLSIRMSYDEGVTWPVKKVLDPDIAGYSDLAVTSDGMIHCFYEGGRISGAKGHTTNSHMSVMHFNLEWLTDGKDKLIKKDKPLNKLK